MIDIHAHFLPDIDDGPSTLEEALAMVEIAEREGIEVVIATPHYAQGQYEPSPERIHRGIAELGRAVAERGFDIAFYPGTEVHLAEDLPDRLRRGEILTLNGTRYVLLELPFNDFPLMTQHVIFELSLKGYRPILAHAERYLPLQDDPSLLYRWAQSGVLAQVTAGSLLGQYGEPARTCARVLLKYGLAQFLATDAHDAKTRSPVLRKALEVVTHWFDRELAEALVRENPARVLSGQPVPLAPEEPRPSRKWLDLSQWWRRIARKRRRRP